jgi:hypothetical protein
MEDEEYEGRSFLDAPLNETELDEQSIRDITNKIGDFDLKNRVYCARKKNPPMWCGIYGNTKDEELGPIIFKNAFPGEPEKFNDVKVLRENVKALTVDERTQLKNYLDGLLRESAYGGTRKKRRPRKTKRGKRAKKGKRGGKSKKRRS